jgi:hypothetical protein
MQSDWHKRCFDQRTSVQQKTATVSYTAEGPDLGRLQMDCHQTGLKVDGWAVVAQPMIQV